MLANLGPDGARAVEDTTPLIEIDEASFHPWRIQPVRHRLSDHPLLQTSSLIGLGERLEAQKSIRTHGNDATAGMPFSDAPASRRARFTLVGS